MTQHSKLQDEMRCPNCGSDSTQSITAAYGQAARTGSSGYESVSLFGELLQPPKNRDETFWPGILVCVVATIALFKLPGILDRLDIGALRDLSSLSWPVAALSCVAGWIAGLCLAIPAIRYNFYVLPQLLAVWQKGMICKQCAHRWQRAPLESEIVEELDHGTR